MTVNRIASLLCRASIDVEARLALCPDDLLHPELEVKLDEAASECRDLIRQRNGLREIFPRNAELYCLQCNALLMEVAARVQEALNAEEP